MLKLLIVDDQKKDLEGISGILNWSGLGIELVGSATDGQEGLRKAVELEPDIVITDVIMPLMDGLAFMEAAHKSIPRTRFIITSCHDDFNYVRKALSMNAVGYVLKPIVASDLQEVVEKTVAACEAEKRKSLSDEYLEKRLKENLPALRDELLRNIAYGNLPDEGAVWDNIAFLGLEIARGMVFSVLYIEVDEYEGLSTSLSIRDRHLLLVGVKFLIQENLSRRSRGYVVPVDESHVAVLVTDRKQDNAPQQYKNLVDLASVLSDELKRDFSLSVTIGASAPVESLLEVERCFSQAKEAVRIKFQLGKGQVILGEDVLQSENCAEYRSDQMLQALKTLLFSGDPSGVDGYVEELIQTNGGRISEAYTQFVCISALNFSQLVLMDLNESLNSVLGPDNRLFERLHRMETAVQIKDCMKETLTKIQTFVTNRTNLRNRHVVNKIEELVRERYATDLSIGGIAHEIYLSPSYASFIFKQENGISFTEYLTKYRIEKSREALKNPNYKIFEVAEMVGYNNKSYFCALFKERTGMTPKEYRESLW